jgi:cell division GTPase FtsZ
MKAVLIGVGQAGGKVARALAEFDDRMGFDAILGTVAVNTAKADLQSLPFETVLVGQDRVKGHGVGGDNELGAELMEADAVEVLDALEGTLTAEAEAIFVVAGLGGGTGSGGAPVLAKQLKRIYDIPVYAIGVLPGRDEGALYQVNAGRSLKTLVREADALLLLDNDAFQSSGESLAAGFERINEAMAQRLGLLLAAGEAVEGVGESVVDSSEVINTLRAGGIASLGYASAEASTDAAENINTVASLTRRAVMTGNSLPEASDADAALLVMAGHPDAIPRKGFERARSWLEEETGTMEVRGGDFPLESGRLAALVLLAGVERSPTVERFLERARQAAQETDEVDAGREDASAAWENEDIESLF